MYVGHKKLRLLRALCAFLCALSLTMLSGCSFLFDILSGDSIEFTVAVIKLEEGEQFDISTVISTTVSYSVRSSDDEIARIDETTGFLVAVAEGTTYVTATAGIAKDRAKVVVSARAPDVLTLNTDGEKVQTYGQTSPITFTATGTGAASAGSVSWYVNDTLVSTLAMGEGFTLTPDEAGEYGVYAICNGVKSELVTVGVYYPVNAIFDYDDSLLNQSYPFRAIAFACTLQGEWNEQKFFQWYIDGEVVYEGQDTSFTYTPSAGRHSIVCKVNGQSALQAEGVFVGSVKPQSPKIEFDDRYPDAVITYEVTGGIQLEVTAPDGKINIYSSQNPEYAALFDSEGFHASGKIDICASGTARGKYKLRVKSLGDGELFTESDYSDYTVFTQLPSAALRYLSESLPCGDLYITSAIEYVEVAQYYIIFRKKAANASVSFNCYIAYEREGSATDLWNDAFDIAATSGLYSDISVKDSDNIMRTSFSVSTVNTPTRQSADESSYYSTQLHAVLPHINFDESKYRDRSHIFPIDRAAKSCEVTYTDELYLTAEYGAKPLPKVGSPAATVYERAREILRKICTHDMTDEQKAHAIYDWILWQVTYDTPASNLRSGGESYSAYYLEGVFGDGENPIGGVRYSPYAVCDGMSKAYSLMCNIEGIPCVRVVGRAGNSLDNAGGHAWNKVKIGGEWYVVDCTWGDTAGTLNISGRPITYELGLHDYLFITDEQISTTHFEPYAYDETTIEYAPKTAKTPINVYKTNSINGVAVDSYISSSQNQTERIREISLSFARAINNISTLAVPGANGDEYSIEYQAVEIRTQSGFTVSDRTILETATSAIRSVHRSATVRSVLMDNTALIMVKI